MKGRAMRKDAKEMKERIIKAVEKACEGKCDFVNVKKSESSNSLYFTISSGNSQVFFRISDHPTRQRIKSFTVSKSTKISAVERFVISNLKRLKKVSLYDTLDLISGALALN